MQEFRVNCKSQIIDKIIIWLLILSPMLNIYRLGVFNLCELLTWSTIAVVFLNNRFYFKMPSMLFCYFIYLLFVTLLSCAFNITELLSRLSGVIHSLLIFALFFSIKDFSYFYKIYKSFVLLAIALFFLQEISYAATGVRILGLIPFLPIDSSFSNASNSYSFNEYLQVVNRSSSFFSEPALFAQYILPFLSLSLYLENGWKRISYFSLGIITLFMLRSGNGIVGLCLLLIIYAFYFFCKFGFLYKIILVFIVIIFFILGVDILLDSEVGVQYMERSGELLLTSENAEETSGFSRIYLGYYVYNEYNVWEKIIGINNFSEIQTKIMQSPYGYLLNGVLYFNTVQHFLIKGGIIGFCFFLILLLGLYRKNNICGKSIIIVFCVYSLMASMYLTPLMIIYLLISLKIKSYNLNNR